MGKQKAIVPAKGDINTKPINDAHRKIYEIVSAYKDISREVSQTKAAIEADWVGDGRNEFQSQYNLLISKITDFGETLEEIYAALVQAEADYATADNDLGRNYQEVKEGMSEG